MGAAMKLNISRGVFRLWIFASVIWSIGAGYLSWSSWTPSEKLEKETWSVRQGQGHLGFVFRLGHHLGVVEAHKFAVENNSDEFTVVSPAGAPQVRVFLVLGQYFKQTGDDGRASEINNWYASLSDGFKDRRYWDGRVPTGNLIDENARPIFILIVDRLIYACLWIGIPVIAMLVVGLALRWVMRGFRLE